MPETQGAFCAISVQNLEEAISWYTEHLGFEIDSKSESDERRGVLLCRPGAILELSEFAGAVATRPGLQSHEVHGIFELGFVTAELDEANEHLERAGVQVFFPIVTVPGGKRTFGVNDSEGYIVQLFGK
ncbi:MAG: VOC family protein [Holophagales bacterium]|nr:VOC family protein [Holophagales bacterium]